MGKSRGQLGRLMGCLLLASALLAGCNSTTTSSTGAAAATASGSQTSAKSMQISSGTSAAQNTVMPGQSFTVTPQVSGAPAGATLTFSAENAPAWMTFNARTGVLSGSPTEADAGTYSNIVMSVSDGEASASALPFSVTVAEANSGSGNATLSWTPPTTNTNGSALTNLAGYHIYYGTSPEALNKVVTVSLGVTSYVIEGLTPGVWYFAVNSYTTTGTQSALSSTASKTIS